MSLKQILHNCIKAQSGGMLSRDMAEHITKRSGYAISNGERRLRPSNSPGIETIFNGKDHIVGYKMRPDYDKLEGKI